MGEAKRISTYIHDLVAGFFSDTTVYSEFQQNLEKQTAIGSVMGFTNFQIIKFAFLETYVSKGLNKDYADAYSTLHGWLHNKVIYEFDSEIAKALDDMRWSDIRDQRVSILNKIPVDSFIIKFNHDMILGSGSYDFIACTFERHLDDIGICGIRLIFGNTTDTGQFIHITPLEIKMDSYSDTKTLYDVYEYNSNTAYYTTTSALKAGYKKVLTTIFPYIFYLCSQNAEISQTPDSIQNYRTPSGQPKNKYSEIKEYKCGESTGEKIRKFKNSNSNYCGTHNSGSGSRKSPHIRRAHYHRFWIGHGENKTQVIRWLPPMVIHPEGQQDITPTVVKVTQ